jgi:hypothetical protein
MLAEEIFDHFAVDAVEGWETEKYAAVMEVVIGAGGASMLLQKLLDERI